MLILCYNFRILLVFYSKFSTYILVSIYEVEVWHPSCFFYHKINLCLDCYVYPLTLHYRPLLTFMSLSSDASDNELIFIFWNWRNRTADTEVTGKFALEYWAGSHITPRRTVQGCVCGSSCRPFTTIMRPPLRELSLLVKRHYT